MLSRLRLGSFRRAFHCEAPSNNQFAAVQAVQRVAMSCTALALFVGIASPKTGILQSKSRDTEEKVLEFLLCKNAKHHFLLSAEDGFGK
mmetsp:Transcript_13591/g.25918  ORF Transcript_13591/g.25918 Transcript_13591/m.25918 type:complete len:89 (+) Transcript_13591:400-666(+)